MVRDLKGHTVRAPGLPTILARVSDGKKGLEQSPCTEPEPAPSPTKPGDVTAPLAGSRDSMSQVAKGLESNEDQHRSTKYD